MSLKMERKHSSIDFSLCLLVLSNGYGWEVKWSRQLGTWVDFDYKKKWIWPYFFAKFGNENSRNFNREWENMQDFLRSKPTFSSCTYWYARTCSILYNNMHRTRNRGERVSSIYVMLGWSLKCTKSPLSPCQQIKYLH